MSPPLAIPPAGTFLCRIDEIDDPGAKGFSFGKGLGVFDLVIVRHSGLVRAYVDACPHMATPLAFLPDQFLTEDKTELLCTTHGARFRIEDGFCTAGPCKGQSLRPFAIDLSGNEIFVGTQK